MSAFIVDKRHIDALVTAAMQPRYGSPLHYRHDDEWRECRDGSEIGAMLWAENVASVEHRYSPPGREAIYGEGFGEAETGSGLPGSYQLEMIAPGVEPVSVPQWLSEYRFVRLSVSPVQVLKALDCYEYQSCEHDDWERSEAYALCQALRSQTIGLLPGYEAADWEIKSC